MVRKRIVKKSIAEYLASVLEDSMKTFSGDYKQVYLNQTDRNKYQLTVGNLIISVYLSDLTIVTEIEQSSDTELEKKLFELIKSGIIFTDKRSPLYKDKETKQYQIFELFNKVIETSKMHYEPTNNLKKNIRKEKDTVKSVIKDFMIRPLFFLLGSPNTEKLNELYSELYRSN